MKRTQMTSHGAALDGPPLSRRWNDAPVKLRLDIEAHAKRIRGYEPEGPLDQLAEIMSKLSLANAAFGSFDQSLDAFVKAKVSSHHQTWLMSPLERLYDDLAAACAADGKAVQHG